MRTSDGIPSREPNSTTEQLESNEQKLISKLPERIKQYRGPRRGLKPYHERPRKKYYPCFGNGTEKRFFLASTTHLNLRILYSLTAKEFLGAIQSARKLTVERHV